MSSITPIQPGLWRFDGLEEEHQFPIVGYIAATPDGLILVDPPHAPEMKDEIAKLGKPLAAVVTSPWHIRGVPHWAKEFQLPVAAPAYAREELLEVGIMPDVVLMDGQEEAGFQVLALKSGAYDEVAFWNPEMQILMVGDLLVVNPEGEVALGPNIYMKVPLEDLRPIVERVAALKPRLILSSHLGPREDAQQILDQLVSAL